MQPENMLNMGMSLFCTWKKGLHLIFHILHVFYIYFTYTDHNDQNMLNQQILHIEMGYVRYFAYFYVAMLPCCHVAILAYCHIFLHIVLPVHKTFITQNMYNMLNMYLCSPFPLKKSRVITPS